jgi:hypothetical protein
VSRAYSRYLVDVRGVEMDIHLPDSAENMDLLRVAITCGGSRYDENRTLAYRIGLAWAKALGRAEHADQAISLSCSGSEYNNRNYKPWCTVVWKLSDDLDSADLETLHRFCAKLSYEAHAR